MPDMGIGTAILGSSLLGAGASIFGSQSAASTQANAANNATQAQLQMFNEAKGLAQPFINFAQSAFSPLSQYMNFGTSAFGPLSQTMDFGASALGPLSRLITPGPDQNAALEQTPGYQFALSQGEKGITNQATMTGLSGNALREGATFASGLASQTWSDVVNKLMSAAGLGTNAASTALGIGTNAASGALNAGTNAAAGVGGQAVQTGTNVGSNIIGAGNAQAGANIATGNAIGGVGNNLTSALLLNSLSGGKLFGSAGLWGSGTANATT